jgi:hypothetical protein
MLLIFGVNQSAVSQPGIVLINSLDPFNGDHGQLVRVLGGQFDRDTSEIKFDGSTQETFYRSSSELWFVIPSSANCGAHSVVVESEVDLAPFGRTTATSPPVIYVVECAGQFSRPGRPTPVIDSVKVDRSGNNTHEMRIFGQDFLPSVEGGYPSSWVALRMDRDATSGQTGAGNTRRVSIVVPGQINSTYENWPFDDCDVTFEIQVFNQYAAGTSENLREYSNTITLPRPNNCAPEETAPPPAAELGELMMSDIVFLPAEAQVGQEFRINFTLSSSGPGPTAPFDYVVKVDGETLLSREDVVVNYGNVLVINPAFTINSPGEHNIFVNAGLYIRTETLNVTSGAPPPPNENPPPVIGGNLADYDQDNDCKLSDGEFFNMIDAWISESIENLLFFSGVDAWIGQTDICAATTSSSSRIELNNTLGGILLSIRGGDPLGLITIYDINGHQVFQSYASGTKLVWNMTSKFGESVANGVYLVRFGNTGELRKFVVVR